MNVEVLDDAEEDLANGFLFYEQQQPDLGRYFFRSLWADIDTLQTNAGIHRVMFGKYYRLLSHKFPYAILYQVVGDTAFVHAVIDCRRSPDWIRRRLK
jgi:plasmid stabilization system protein ParE